MSTETKAVLFNAVPLLLLAALYLAAGVALAPVFWRERRRLRELAYVSALLFPCVGVAAATVGVQLLIEQKPLGGHLWLSLPAIAVAAAPIVALFANWRDRELLVTGLISGRAAAELTSLRDRELQAVERLSRGLARVDQPEQIGRLVADEATELFGVDIAQLAVLDASARRARLVAAREAGSDVDWLLGAELDLEREASGIGALVAQPAPFAVFDARSSTIVSRRLVERAGVASVAFVPVFADDRTIGALVVGTRTPRMFGGEELSLMQAFASEAGIALARAASAVALAEALERERLVARISLEVRARVALDDLLNVACAESARAVGCDRCFIRLAEPGQPPQKLVQWAAEGVEPVDARSELPVSSLAARERRTVTVADVREAHELRDPTLGRVEAVVARGTLAVLATPMVAYGSVIGTFSFERSEPGAWTEAEMLLAEAVAREAASAVHTARILQESERRLAEQTALLSAGQALTSELRFDAVISRIVEEMRTLLHADAVDCWTLRPGGRELECRAVLGLPDEAVGSRRPVSGSLAETAEPGVPVLRRGPDAESQSPLAGEAGFAESLEAPLLSFGEVRGVLAAHARESGTFSADDLRLMAAFASLAALALRNAEAFEESARRAQVERGFYRIAAVLGEPLSAEATLDAVAQAAVEALGGDCGAVLRPAAAGGLELAGAHELPEPLAQAFLGDGSRELAEAAAGGKVLASRSLVDDTRFGESLSTVAEAAGLSSLLAVPLPQPRTDANGLVLVFFAGEHRFSDEQLELAGHIAGAARGALERSDLYESERHSRALAQRLATAGRDLASELDPEDVLARAAEHAAGLIGAAAAAVWVLEVDELVIHAAAGEGTAGVLETRVPSTAWLLGDIVQTRRPTALADAAEDERAAEIDPLLAAGYAAVLAGPLTGPDGSLRGVISVYSRTPREWREEDAEALLALAASAGAAQANALQYQAVRHEQQRSEAILANVADGIVAVDREGQVVLWNRAAEEITGVPAAEALGRLPAQVLGGSLADDGGRTPTGNRLVPIRRGSDEAWLSLSEAVMTDPAGAVAGRIYAFRDISGERAVEQMKSDFVSTVSHELRTPLTSIFGFAETLLRQDVLFGEEERNTFLRYISSESERLTAIVDRLLSVAQLDTGAMSVQVGTTEVGRVVEDVLGSAQRKLGGNGHDFVLALDDEPLAAQADPEKLKQVLNHLLDNAVRYSPAGGRVTVAARRADGAVEVRVEDEGVGIPRAEQERIFRKFYRGESAARTSGAGATGLGLFLAAGLVEAMGGRIWVDSDEGRGATFVVELPAAVE